MKRKILPVLIAGAFAVPAFADNADPWISESAFTVGGIGSNASGRDPSKLEEYQDLNSGVLSSVFTRGRDGKTWVDFYGENFGRNDQFITLRGGQYDTFKFGIQTNWIPHNFLEQGLTPFQGSGTGHLTPISAFPMPNPATWNTVNLGYERKDTRGYFEWQATSPWYTRIEGQQFTFQGTKPGSGAVGTSPGQGFMDLAIPVAYTTSNASAEIGYNSLSSHFALNYLYSRFENGQQSLTWINPYFGNNIDTTFLPADNTYQRIAANGTMRGLPAASTFAARYTWAKTTNGVDVPGTVLTSGTAANSGVYTPTLGNTDHFSGDLVDQTLSLTLSSTPATNFDSKIYYNWQKRENNSTQVVFAGTSTVNCDSGPCQGTLYDYRKNNFGLEGIWRFDRANRLSGGYDYLDIHQNRVDYDDVTTNKVWVEYKNTSLEDLTLRIRYYYLQRRSNFLLGSDGVNAADPNYLNRFVARFDNSDANQNNFKFVGEWSPMPLLDASIEAILRTNDYPGTVLGRTSDKRHELFGILSYGDFDSFRVSLIGDYEWVKYNSYHRNISNLTAVDAYDPGSVPNSSNYNWSAKNTDDNWLLGVGLDWKATDRVVVKGSIQYFKSDGNSSVESQNNYGSPIPITAYDDWKQTEVNVKAIYTFDRRWSFTAGYAYNKVDYNDIAYNGYQYTIPYPGVTNNTSQSYLNGYRAFPNSDMNTVYVLATMRF